MAIIGFGNQGQWHCDNIKDRVPEIEIVGAYDIKPEKQEFMIARGIKVFSSPEEIWNSNEIQVVLVSTPNNFHRDYCISAMLAGKNVVCEKPVCMNLKELDEVLAVADKTGLVFTVHQNRRWDVDYRVIKNVIDQNLIGKPYFIDSRLFGCKGLPGDWRSCKETGGGMLYDWSVHLIDQMIDLVKSKPLTVYVEAVKVRFPEVDDCNRILVTFENGVHYQIVVDSWCYIGENRWHVCGDDGTALVPNWGFADGKVIKANIKEIGWEEGFVFTANGRSSTMAPRPVEALQEFVAPVPEMPEWEEFFRNFVNVVNGKEELIVKHEESRLVMKIIDACFRSIENGTVEKI